MRIRIKEMLMRLTVAGMAAGIIGGIKPIVANAEEEGLKACYSGFFYARGWSGMHEDNTLCQAPAGSYLTSFQASVRNQPEGMTGTLAYQVYVNGLGWLDWAENLVETGTTDTPAPVEALRMRLTGQLAENYDVYYSVFQSDAWSPWTKNEETAGVTDQGLMISGIKVSITTKDGEQPPDIPAGPVIDYNRPMVALTFDDGPNLPVTNRILDVLESNGARGTFFMVGNRVPANADAVRRMAALNCQVGNHTFDHKYLTKMTDAGIRTSVGQTNDNVKNIAGVAPVLMRPTGGFYNQASLDVLGSMGMSAVMWSIDTLDWKTRDPAKTISAVLDHVQDGDIILMHDLYGTTADAVEVIVPELAARGYQMVTVSELAEARGGMVPGHVYSRFRLQQNK